MVQTPKSRFSPKPSFRITFFYIVSVKALNDLPVSQKCVSNYSVLIAALFSKLKPQIFYCDSERIKNVQARSLGKVQRALPVFLPRLEMVWELALDWSRCSFKTVQKGERGARGHRGHSSIVCTVGTLTLKGIISFSGKVSKFVSWKA